MENDVIVLIVNILATLITLSSGLFVRTICRGCHYRRVKNGKICDKISIGHLLQFYQFFCADTRDNCSNATDHSELYNQSTQSIRVVYNNLKDNEKEKIIEAGALMTLHLHIFSFVTLYLTQIIYISYTITFLQRNNNWYIGSLRVVSIIIIISLIFRILNELHQNDDMLSDFKEVRDIGSLSMLQPEYLFIKIAKYFIDKKLFKSIIPPLATPILKWRIQLLLGASLLALSNYLN